MKRGLIFILIVSILFVTPYLSADVSEDGYKCLNEEIADITCDFLNIEERSFSLLAVGQCKDEIINRQKSEDCFASGSGCDLEETAKAVVALTIKEENVEENLEWIKTQNATSEDLEWLLQIDSSPGSLCTLNDSDSDEYSFEIGEYGITQIQDGSDCFNKEGDYRISVDSSCNDKSFEISCNNSFSTTIFFKSENFPTLHILDKTIRSSADYILEKTLPSYCLSETSSCNYEDTLWSVLALNLNGESIQEYLPYLIASKDSNPEYLPEAFLYYLTSEEDYLASLLSKQLDAGYWDLSSNGKYYDTALTYMLIGSSGNIDEALEKTLAWLEDSQDKSGCWHSKDVLDTAFILYSIFPTSTYSLPNNPETQEMCEDNNGHCMSYSSCTDLEGEELNYSCYGFDICCSEEEIIPSCTDSGGEICARGEECSGDFFDGAAEDRCCVDGNCFVPLPGEEENTCESEEYGTCQSSCDSGYEEISIYTCDSGSVCCVKKEIENLNLYIAILAGLIILVLLGILFRKQLRNIFHKKPKGPSSGSPQNNRGMPPRRMMPPQGQRMPQRRPMPQGQPINRKPLPKKNRSKDLDDVLSKLKEMSEK